MTRTYRNRRKEQRREETLFPKYSETGVTPNPISETLREVTYNFYTYGEEVNQTEDGQLKVVWKSPVSSTKGTGDMGNPRDFVNKKV